MKILILSDIHSNWNYLSQLIPSIEAQKVDQIFFLGDSIGYYNEPNNVLDWLRSKDAKCIKGNHEQYFLNEIDYVDAYEDMYRVKENRVRVSALNKKFIESWSSSLDIKLNGQKFLMVHGEIENSEKYMYECSDLDKKILKKYDFYVYGHTHVPMIQYHYGCCIINPGSIGQPRDYTQQPSYVIIDLDEMEVTIKKYSVDSKNYIDYLRANNYSDKVVDILTRQYK